MALRVSERSWFSEHRDLILAVTGAFIVLVLLGSMWIQAMGWMPEWRRPPPDTTTREARPQAIPAGKSQPIVMSAGEVAAIIAPELQQASKQRRIPAQFVPHDSGINVILPPGTSQETGYVMVRLVLDVMRRIAPEGYWTSDAYADALHLAGAYYDPRALEVHKVYVPDPTVKSIPRSHAFRTR